MTKSLVGCETIMVGSLIERSANGPRSSSGEDADKCGVVLKG